MWKSIISAENIVSSIANLAIFGGVIAAGVYRAEPNLVNLFTLLALAGLFLDLGLRWAARLRFSRLSGVEATDLSFLRQIRYLLRRGEEITEEHLSASESASAEADREYREVYGFGRPFTAVAANHKSLKNQNL